MEEDEEQEEEQIVEEECEEVEWEKAALEVKKLVSWE